VDPFALIQVLLELAVHLMISGLKKKEYTAHPFRYGFATRLTEKNVNILLV
jgi:hypothetical protein